MRKMKDEKDAASPTRFPRAEPLRYDPEQSKRLIIACVEGKLSIARNALENKADPDARDKYGRTALMHCAMENFDEIAKLLLSHGADPKAKDNAGHSAHAYAAMFYNKRMMRLLERSVAA